jgi:hypothetical protein
MEFLFFVGFPLITFFLGLTAGYIYGSKTATEALRPVADELNRRIDSEVTNLNNEVSSLAQRVDAELKSVYGTVSDLRSDLETWSDVVDNLEDGFEVTNVVQNNLNKAASKISKSRGRRKSNK